MVQSIGRLASTSTTVGTTATAIPATGMTGRLSVSIKNNGAATVYLGPSTVTTDNGYPLAAGAEISLDANANCPIYGIVASGTVDIRTLEGC